MNCQSVACEAAVVMVDIKQGIVVGGDLCGTKKWRGACAFERC